MRHSNTINQYIARANIKRRNSGRTTLSLNKSPLTIRQMLAKGTLVERHHERKFWMDVNNDKRYPVDNRWLDRTPGEYRAYLNEQDEHKKLLILDKVEYLPPGQYDRETQREIRRNEPNKTFYFANEYCACEKKKGMLQYHREGYSLKNVYCPECKSIREREKNREYVAKHRN